MSRDFTRRRVIVNQIDEIWSADLVKMQNYLLTVIDVFSKYGWKKRKVKLKLKHLRPFSKKRDNPNACGLIRVRSSIINILKSF